MRAIEEERGDIHGVMDAEHRTRGSLGAREGRRRPEEQHGDEGAAEKRKELRQMMLGIRPD